MPGKRPRTMQRTTSVLNMEPGFPPDSSPLPEYSKERSKPPTTPRSAIRQVIGFNPTPKCETSQAAEGYFNPFLVPEKAVSQEKQGGAPGRSPVSPRSALQTLLAAARQGGIKEIMEATVIPPLVENAYQDRGKLHPFMGKPETEQGFEGITVKAAEQKTFLWSTLKQAQPAYTKEIGCAVVLEDPGTPIHTSRCNHMTQGPNYLQEASSTRIAMGVDSIAHKGSHHFLFLATSPITDVTVLAPTINFLDACYLCKRPLGHGLDIFMYRGDKAFCSVECRYQQIVMDERKEKCSPSLLRSGSASAAHHGRNHKLVLTAGTAAVA